MTRRPSSYVGVIGTHEVYFAARVDLMQRIIEVVSGKYPSRSEAAEALRWVRRRHPDARLVRELIFQSLEG